MKQLLIKYACIICLVNILGCSGSSKPEPKAQPVLVDEDMVQLSAAQAKQIDLMVEEIQPRKMSATLKLNGQIDVPPQNLISVSVPLGGYLKSSSLLPGTQVSKGQLLAVMEDPQYIQLQQDYLIIKNKVAFATKEYARQKELNIGKANSDKVVQQAENELRQLTIESQGLAEKLRLIGLNPAQLTENKISRTINIYSPINGYVSKVNVNIGKYVTPSDVIFELVNPTDIHLNLIVFEKDLHLLKIGQQVTAYANTKPEQKYNTKIVLVSHSLNSDRSTEVHCHIEKYDKALAPGMYMNAEVQLDHKEVEALPNAAIVNFENKDFVFVALADQTFKMTAISKGQSVDGFTAVDSTLKGKKVVIKGAYSLLMKLKNTIDE
ncbi:efflux RND transporter periplasmic adaptor subunit [Pedobacter sp. Hv1]|uniref:efflux RND transporter periplasmic adaptor subunit n=1 Tax=Pedobacter sp. Hv1 TaxID=1740090 RepID=UPI0006D8BCF1|nr:efflux RND transporter periplasmic adaptor subunit [Pedobacter sp. Hv1]KQC01795.1 hemolysin D [Pedobacter sp. Hv1]